MAVQGSTLNPSDIATGSGTEAPVLSNGNLTLTAVSSNNFACIRATGGLSSGAFQFSVTINVNGHGTPAQGIVLSSANLATFGASGAGFPGGLMWHVNGAVDFNGTAGATTWQSFGQGDTITFAVNVTTQEIWGQVDGGLWNNTPDASPSLGIGGFSFAALGAGEVQPVGWICDFNGTASEITFSFSAPDQLPAEATSLLVWARIIYPIGLPDGGTLWGATNWSNRFSASFSGTPQPAGNPAAAGGMPMAGPIIQPNVTPALYLTAAGTGDAGLVLNTGSDPIGNAFKAKPPPGFGWGWPNGYGLGGGHLDVNSVQGSAVVTDYFTVSFPATPGLAQSEVGVTTGSYYFEYEVSYDIFSQNAGVGIGRKGANVTAWLDGGGYNLSGDNNGGAQIGGGNIGTSPEYQPVITCNRGPGLNVPLFADNGAVSGTWMGVAVSIGAFNPFVFNAQSLQPVPLSCLPCRDLLIGPGGFGGFGR